MRNDREQAMVLRRSGMTYSDIKARLGIPRSTLSTWFKDQQWSEEVTRETIRRRVDASKIRLMVLNAIRGSRLKKIYEEARQDAIGDYGELKLHPLFIAGVMTYWAHGDKTSKSRVSVSSCDPAVIKIFNLFLRNVCAVEKLRVNLLLGQNIDEEASKAYWIEKSALQAAYFTKIVKITLKSRTQKQKYGVCNVTVNSAYLKNKILKWLELLIEDISQENYTAGMV